MIEALTRWIWKITRQNWIITTLLGIMLSVLIIGFQDANWVQDELGISLAFLAGIGIGWMLARSRFSGWFALPYALVISVVIAVEALGNVLPAPWDLFNSPFRETLEQMNLRIYSVSLRMGGWVDTLRLGDNVADPGTFVLLLSLLLALCGIWLMWEMLRKRNALLGLLPVGLLFAINVHLGKQALSSYMVFLLCALLLVAYTEFCRQHEDWDRRKVDYPDQLGLEWGGSALALAVIIVLIARGAPWVGTPEGWQAISEWVNRANEQTSDTATRLFSGVNPPPGDEREIFVNTPSMGKIGAPISQGYRTIMWVRISDPAPTDMGPSEPIVIPYIHYWRSDAYGQYTGRGWEPVPTSGESAAQPDELPEDPPAGRYYLRQGFSLEARHYGALFATNNPVQTDKAVRLFDGGDSQSKRLVGNATEYQVISAATKITSNQLIEAGVDYPAEISAAYLQLPDSLPERVRSLAQRIASGAETPYEKTLKIQSYLRENYTYDTSAAEAPEGRDAVDYFLFDAPTGFCSHYASAMTVMLRAEGIPSRVAAGYAMGEYDFERQSFRVPESAAHAWVEVYFPGYGWVEFEPTVIRAAIEYYDEQYAASAMSGEPVGIEEGPLVAQPTMVVLVIAGALALLALPFLLLRMFSTARQIPVVQVDGLYRRMRRALSWAGLRAGASVTPDEYLTRYTERLEKYEQVHQALVQVTALYRETVYSSHAPDQGRVRRASLQWRRSFGQWMKLWLNLQWNNLREKFSK